MRDCIHSGVGEYFPNICGEVSLSMMHSRSPTDDVGREMPFFQLTISFLIRLSLLSCRIRRSVSRLSLELLLQDTRPSLRNLLCLRVTER